MVFGHERLDVYRLSLEYVKLVFELVRGLDGSRRHARDQLLRASQSIPLNIAEGNGKATPRDRRRFFEIARGSTLECAAIQDVLSAGGAIGDDQNQAGKQVLDRIAAMLTRLGGRAYAENDDTQG
jgi:four helix bundle protein